MLLVTKCNIYSQKKAPKKEPSLISNNCALPSINPAFNTELGAITVNHLSVESENLDHALMLQSWHPYHGRLYRHQQGQSHYVVQINA